MNIYIVYEINFWLYTKDANFTLGNSFFGAFKLTKNNDPDKSFYSGYGSGFDARVGFLLTDGSGFGKNNIWFRYDLFCTYQ